MDSVKFTRMKDGDREDYEFLERHERAYAAGAADRLLALVASLDDSMSGYRVSRLQHCLQSATRAWRDGADIDWVVTALLHDIGDVYAPYNHDEFAAAVLRPFVREQCAWTVEAHGDFQKIYYAHLIGGDPEARQRHRASPYFDDCEMFCERWDQTAFDPDFDALPLDFFAPMVREVFAREPFDPAVVRPGARVPLVDPVAAAGRRSTVPA